MLLLLIAMMLNHVSTEREEGAPASALQAAGDVTINSQSIREGERWMPVSQDRSFRTENVSKPITPAQPQPLHAAYP
jgi:hypothetical protein